MKKLVFLLLVLIFTGCTVLTPLQRSKLISVYHLIEIGNYEDAKNLVEEMIKDKDMSQWSRTWYARGLISQNAYREGIQKNDRKKTELYPDQLYVAWTSFERARIFDRRGRLNRHLEPRYVLLVNDFQKLGERHYAGGRYEEALRAFEQALRITQSPLLSVHVDNDLMYNAALAAFEGRNKEKAKNYLIKLNEQNYSTNVSHLLFKSYLETGDTLKAENVLTEGITKFNYDEGLVLLLVDFLYEINEIEKALGILDAASVYDQSNYIFPYTKGLVFQKSEQYNRAIDAYKRAVDMAPDEVLTYVNLATCYYNIGVDIEENARLITNNRRVMEEKARSTEAFDSAIKWLDKAYDKNPESQTVNLKIFQLYSSLSVTDKVRIMQGRVN
jgi:tetratricopeptide (TPR) repeat protein